MTRDAELTLTGALCLLPDVEEPVPAEVSLAGERIAGIDAGGGGRRLDVSGHWLLPGIVDAHGDGFERHVAPRRGAVDDIGGGLAATEAELAANGITTAWLAQFWSWEGGMRGPDFARRFLAALSAYRGLGTDLRAQLRLETHLVEDFPEAARCMAAHGVRHLVFNDHLPHKALETGRKVPRLTGQALKSGRSPEAHQRLLEALHANGPRVPEAIDALLAELPQGMTLGSHDDQSAADREGWRARGVSISEFPETEAAARAAHEACEPVILGAPNVLRGGSHKGNASARDLVAAGLCTALASDYHYPAPARAALSLARDGVLPLGAAWGLVSAGPAAALGLTDRGSIAAGKRADLLLLEPETGRIAATIAGGAVTHLAGPLARQLLG